MNVTLPEREEWSWSPNRYQIRHDKRPMTKGLSLDHDPVNWIDLLGLDATISVYRDDPPAGADPRRSPARFILEENGKQLYSGRCNVNGFMKRNNGETARGIPQGNYTIEPKKTTGNFPIGTPAITGKGRPPGQPADGYQADAVLIHSKSSSGNPDSLACMTVDPEDSALVKQVMDRNLNNGGTKMRVVDRASNVERAIIVNP